MTPWVTITGSDVRVGDTFMPDCNDRQFFVAALAPYTGPLLALLGEGSQVAETVSNAGRHPMTIPASSRYRIVSRAGATNG